MGNLSRQVGSELKQLPLMLGKLVGGVTAAAGFGAAVWLATRGSGNPVIPFLIALAGIVLFVLSDRKMAGRTSASGTLPAPAERRRMNVLSWSLLFLLVAIFLLCIEIFLR